ncbi:hypothetical protein FC36_GL001407 [Ligilactobacillus equi DSM 15833 = JCM 10991]|uniref:LysM domain-containing protein n=1 Tax=Ligilactobacillus equi DSM 15833 = JCM 10991 TaxID=1423740 RepID=A0A0R1TPE4_9LACO|nr:LysM peptidoglycan-binding domain-containing protein [Ligilactobacillus equi]KRL81812.1 hypothetical protein FC36_GL001407 [Ligilactobacillus equi DSM 15833 = JCM 10991]
MAKLTDGKKTVEIFALSEEESIENKVSQYPVQSGNPITDHTQRESFTETFSGWIKGKDHNEINDKWSQLMNWQYAGASLTWHGAIIHGNLMLTNITKTYEDGGFKNALKVDLELREVKTVSASYAAVKHVGPVNPPKPKANPAVYVTVVPGNTYWGWWRKYGTPIQTLRNWNHWPDRFIPVGARARVK